MWGNLDAQALLSETGNSVVAVQNSVVVHEKKNNQKFPGVVAHTCNSNMSMQDCQEFKAIQGYIVNYKMIWATV